MIETDEIVLKSDGTAIRRTYTERPCNVVDKIQESMSQNVTRVIKRVGVIDSIPYHLVRSGTETFAVMTLPSLNLTTPWKMDSDGLMRPLFDDASGENPSMQLAWPPSPGMALVFAARIYTIDAGRVATRYKDACYLLAMDSSFKSFLLPLPNLFDTGYMCMGEFDGTDATIHGAFQKAYNQLQHSKWNADLYSSDRKSKVKQMMAFKPEGEKFVPVPCKEWAGLLSRCEGVTIEMLKGALKP